MEGHLESLIEAVAGIPFGGRSLPSGIVSHGEKWVRSETIKLPNHESTCYINGRFDVVVSFDDGTYGVIDYKTSKPSEDSARMYSRQLHAYAYALEHPAPGKLALSPVTKLGLLYFYPDNVNQQSIDRLNYGAEIVWVEVEKDEGGFLSFIRHQNIHRSASGVDILVNWIIP